jgi:mRNA degradation ribonuclease J1/J2
VENCNAVLILRLICELTASANLGRPLMTAEMSSHLDATLKAAVARRLRMLRNGRVFDKSEEKIAVDTRQCQIDGPRHNRIGVRALSERPTLCERGGLTRSPDYNRSRSLTLIREIQVNSGTFGAPAPRHIRLIVRHLASCSSSHEYAYRGSRAFQYDC